MGLTGSSSLGGACRGAGGARLEEVTGGSPAPGREGAVSGREIVRSVRERKDRPLTGLEAGRGRVGVVCGRGTGKIG
jgi:hypothetical protein